MSTERVLQVYFIKKCRQAGLLAYKLVCVGRRGFPDVLVIDRRGVSHYIELKSPSGVGRLSIHQIYMHDELREHNADVRIFESKKQCNAFIDELGVNYVPANT